MSGEKTFLILRVLIKRITRPLKFTLVIFSCDVRIQHGQMFNLNATHHVMVL